MFTEYRGMNGKPDVLKSENLYNYPSNYSSGLEVMNDDIFDTYFDRTVEDIRKSYDKHNMRGYEAAIAVDQDYNGYSAEHYEYN
jgi:hypothetical protein